MRCSQISLAALLMLAAPACDDNNGAIRGSGLIETTEVVVSAEVSGRVLHLRVNEGAVVRENDTLALIDPSRLELQLASLQASREVITANLHTAEVASDKAETEESYAKSELDRVSRLLKSGTSSQKQYDQLEFEHERAQLARLSAEGNVTAINAEIGRVNSEINSIERELRDCRPLAPISGVVTEKYTEQGELLAPGKPILKIARLDTVWVKLYLAAGDFAKTKVGDRAMVSTESGGQDYDGVVVWTAEEAEFTPKNVQTAESRAGLVYAVKVSIPNVDGLLKVGMPVFITLEKP
jgi:HlyD family secretion protein